MLKSRSSSEFSRRSGGFTLVELLVVITIIGILIMMLLPAVNSVRESGRFLQCKNNMKQFGTACLAHEQAQGFFPTGGWGWFWQGDPDCGFNNQQPGGWIYNILPYVEMTALHDQQFVVSGTQVNGRTGPGQSPNIAMKQQAIISMVSTPLPMMMCPTRRRAVLYPYAQQPLAYNCGGIQAPSGLQVGRTDYAINVGDVNISEFGTGPTTYSPTDGYFSSHNTNVCHGISFQQSMVRKDDVKDGLSQTMLLGEKYLAANAYGVGASPADNETAYVGMDNDIGRTTFCPPKQDRWGDGTNGAWAFGSAHPTACNFVLCDDSVMAISYAVDAENFRRLGTRDETPAAPVNMGAL